MRKTKIVCTIGPACDSEEMLRAMMLAGMNVARLNFSHGTHAEHQVRIDRIKKLRAELDLPIAIMLDTKGPEYRIGTFEGGKIELHNGDTFTFTTEPVTGNAERVSVSYAGLAQDLEPGNTVLVNDGLIALTVTATTDTDVICRVTAGGVLSDRKSMSFPNKVLKQVFLSEQDKSDLLFGIKNDVDFIACSFVSRRQDLIDLGDFLRANGGGHIDIIAKIENQSGIDNIEDIFKECDGIMIGRAAEGDPWIFKRVNHYLETGELLPLPTREERREMILRHAKMQLDEKGENCGMREMRKHVAWYTAGLPHSARLRGMVGEISTYHDLEVLLEKYL